jgi:TolB-like protein
MLRGNVRRSADKVRVNAQNGVAALVQ